MHSRRLTITAFVVATIALASITPFVSGSDAHGTETTPEQVAATVVETQPWLSQRVIDASRRPYDPQMVAQEARQEGVSEANAERIEMQNQYLAVTAMAMALAEGRYSGAALDHDRLKATLTIQGLTDQDRSDILAAVRSQSSTEDLVDRIKFRSTEYSFDELANAKTVVDDQLMPNLAENVIVQVDVERNAVEVIASDDATLSTLQKRMEDDAFPSAVKPSVDPKVGDYVDTATCVSRLDCTNDTYTRGGLGIDDDASGYQCTSAFTTGSPNNTNTYALTAGHCFGGGDDLYHNGDDFGGVPPSGIEHSSGSPTDSGRIDIYASWDSNDGWIYRAYGDQRSSIDGLFTTSYCALNCTGMFFTKSGGTSDSLMASVDSSYVTIGGHTESLRLNHDQCGGDSGAPIYDHYDDVAIGIAFSGIDSAGYSINGRACYEETGASHIEEVLDIHDLYLK